MGVICPPVQRGGATAQKKEQGCDPHLSPSCLLVGRVQHHSLRSILVITSYYFKQNLRIVAEGLEVLGIIQYYHDVTHTMIRIIFHSVQTMYTYKRIYQDFENYLNKNPLPFLYSEFLHYSLDQDLSGMSNEYPLITSTSVRVATNTST